MMICAVTHFAGRNSNSLPAWESSAGRAATPALPRYWRQQRHPGTGGSCIPAAEAAASRRWLLHSPGCADLCWCFPEARRFPFLARSFTNPFGFFASIWYTVRKKWRSQFLQLACSEGQKNILKWELLLFFTARLLNHGQKTSKLLLLLSPKTHHIMCSTTHNQGIRPSQHGFMKGRSCLTNLTFYDQVTHLVTKQMLWMSSTWTLVRHLTLFPTASSWRNWLPMVWMGVLSAG